MRLPGPARDAPAVDSPGKGLDRLEERLLLTLEASAGRCVETAPAAAPVHGPRLGPAQRGGAARTLEAGAFCMKFVTQKDKGVRIPPPTYTLGTSSDGSKNVLMYSRGLIY